MVTEAVMYKKCLVSPRPVPPANCDSSLTNPERHMHGKSPGWADVLICPLSFPSLLQIAPRGREKQQRFTDLGRGSQMCRLFVFSRCRLLVSRWRGRHSSSHVANGDLVPQSIECHHDAKGFALVTPQGQHTLHEFIITAQRRKDRLGQLQRAHLERHVQQDWNVQARRWRDCVRQSEPRC